VCLHDLLWAGRRCDRVGEGREHQCGDGIMSAINFRLDVKRVPDPDGDRVVITLDGKYLPYQW
jgi:cyanate lyase